MLKPRDLSIHELEQRVGQFFSICGRSDVFQHSLKVAHICKGIAAKYSMNENHAYACGLLHDLGRAYGDNEMVDFCSTNSIDIVEEETRAPGILHQKVSKLLASSEFEIDDEAILSAIEVHTTLCENPTDLALALFVSDKLSWDSNDNDEFTAEMLEMLDVSLRGSAAVYLKHLLSNPDNLPVVHPWTKSAYRTFCQ